MFRRVFGRGNKATAFNVRTVQKHLTNLNAAIKSAPMNATAKTRATNAVSKIINAVQLVAKTAKQSPVTPAGLKQANRNISNLDRALIQFLTSVNGPYKNENLNFSALISLSNSLVNKGVTNAESRKALISALNSQLEGYNNAVRTQAKNVAAKVAAIRNAGNNATAQAAAMTNLQSALSGLGSNSVVKVLGNININKLKQAPTPAAAAAVVQQAQSVRADIRAAGAAAQAAVAKLPGVAKQPKAVRKAGRNFFINSNADPATAKVFYSKNAKGNLYTGYNIPGNKWNTSVTQHLRQYKFNPSTGKFNRQGLLF